MEDRSLLDIARDYLLSCDKQQNIESIYQAVQSESGLSDEDFMEVKSQFYTDFTLCSSFIYCGKDEWDIKTRQKIELYDCDSTFFLDDEEKKKIQKARKEQAKKEESHENVDSISGYEGFESYEERDDEVDSFDDVDQDDLIMADDHYEEDDDEYEEDEEDYDLDQYEDLYEE